MAGLNYEISISAASRVGAVFDRLEQQFARINSAMERLSAASKSAESGAINAARGIDKIGDSADQSSKKSLNLGNAIATGMIKAQAAIALVSGAVSFLTDKFKVAAQTQLESITASSTLSSITGLSSQQATEFNDRLGAQLSSKAASLPGDTAAYQRIFRSTSDSVAPAFLKDGVFDQAGFGATALNLSSTFGAIGAAGGLDAGAVGMGLTRALSGGSTAELKQLQLFENNPILANAIDESLAKMGAKSLKDLTLMNRLKVILDAGAKIVTPAFIEQSSNSVSGLTAGFQSLLFDEDAGLFGLKRDLDSKLPGVQSAFTSFNTVLSKLIGGDGVFAQIQGILGAFNLPDPMQLLKNALDFASGVLDKLINILQGINGLLSSGFDAASTLPLLVGQIFEGFLSVVEGLGTGFDPDKFGAVLADGLDAIFVFFGELFSGAIFGFGTDKNSVAARVAMILGGFVSGAISTIASFFTNLDSSTWMGLAAVALGAILVPAIVGGLGAIALPLIGAASIALVGGVPILLLIAATAAFGALAAAIVANQAGILASLEPFFAAFRALGAAVSAVFDVLRSVLQGDFDGAVANAQIAAGTLGAAMNALGGVFAAMFDSVASAANMISVPLGGGRIQTIGERQASAVSRRQQDSAVAKAYPDRSSQGGGRWAGYIPSTISAFEGLFSAAAQEASRMPSGAELAIANTSEAILTPAMLRNLVSGSVSMGASGVSGGNQITNHFSISGVSDPDAVAQRVLALLDKYLSDEMQGQIA